MDDETKILLKQLLSKLDPEDIAEVLSVGEKKEEPEKNEGSAHVINKRRGSGRNKRNNNRLLYFWINRIIFRIQLSEYN